jgi:dTDP-4-dehydrorhamnose 3,5-epimerase
MNARPLAIPAVILFEPEVFGDDRGFFFESFNHAEFEAALGRPVTFVQDNHSCSVKNVLRACTAESDGLKANCACRGRRGV